MRLGERNRTAHEGSIRDIDWHFKDQRHNYYLEERGKKVSKRYFDDDVECVDAYVTWPRARRSSNQSG